MVHVIDSKVEGRMVVSILQRDVCFLLKQQMNGLNMSTKTGVVHGRVLTTSQNKHAISMIIYLIILYLLTYGTYIRVFSVNSLIIKE